MRYFELLGHNSSHFLILRLNELFSYLCENLAKFDSKIGEIKPVYGENRAGDIPHSLASIEKATRLLGYTPKFSVKQGLQEATKWYFENL